MACRKVGPSLLDVKLDAAAPETVSRSQCKYRDAAAQLEYQNDFPCWRQKAQLARSTVLPVPAAYCSRAVTSLGMPGRTPFAVGSYYGYDGQVAFSRGEKIMRITIWGIMFLLVSLPGAAAARQDQQTPPASGQSQQDSLAAAARRAREAKKSQSKPVKVWDNDSLAAVPDTVSVVGQPVESTPNSAPTNSSNPAPARPASAKDKSGIEGDLTAAKASLQDLKTDLDILQRKYALDQQAYYGKPEYSSDTAGAAALADEKNQMDAKQQEVADTEKKVADLQAQLDALDKKTAE
jgi:hypothetical protein